MVSKTSSKRKKILSKLEEWASKLKPHEIIDILLYGTVAYYGYRAVPKEFPLETKIGGATFSMVSLKLAQSPNLIAGASGVAGLGGVGLANIVGSDMAIAKGAAASWQDFIDLISKGAGQSP